MTAASCLADSKSILPAALNMARVDCSEPAPFNDEAVCEALLTEASSKFAADPKDDPAKFAGFKAN